MRILTLWQPWASLVALGLKQNETRSWFTRYRGPIAIHAAKRPFVSADGSKVLDREAHRVWLDALRLGYELKLISGTGFPLAHQLPLGAVVAIAELEGCYKIEAKSLGREVNYFDGKEISAFIGNQNPTQLELLVGNWAANRFAWRFEQIKAISPILFKGSQGLRGVPDELKILLQEAGVCLE